MLENKSNHYFFFPRYLLVRTVIPATYRDEHVTAEVFNNPTQLLNIAYESRDRTRQRGREPNDVSMVLRPDTANVLNEERIKGIYFTSACFSNRRHANPVGPPAYYGPLIIYIYAYAYALYPRLYITFVLLWYYMYQTDAMLWN